MLGGVFVAMLAQDARGRCVPGSRRVAPETAVQFEFLNGPAGGIFETGRRGILVADGEVEAMQRRVVTDLAFIEGVTVPIDVGLAHGAETKRPDDGSGKGFGAVAHRVSDTCRIPPDGVSQGAAVQMQYGVGLQDVGVEGASRGMCHRGRGLRSAFMRMAGRAGTSGAVGAGTGEGREKETRPNGGESASCHPRQYTIEVFCPRDWTMLRAGGGAIVWSQVC